MGERKQMGYGGRQAVERERKGPRREKVSWKFDVDLGEVSAAFGWKVHSRRTCQRESAIKCGVLFSFL